MSWESLRQVYEEAKQLREDERRRRPVACPDDGTPLENGPRGELHCRHCGWTDRWVL